MFRPVPRRKLHQEIATQIADAIGSGAYEAGAELPSERALMVSFGVGRPSVREALAVLQNDGLVEIHHGRRARVADRSTWSTSRRVEIALERMTRRPQRFVEDIKEARFALEVAMARRAAVVASKADIDRLMRALDANQRAISSRDDYLRTDIDFHRTIASITGNAIFEELATAILEWLARFRIDALHVEGANLLSHDEHAAIARAIAARDPAAAAAAMERHQSRVHGLYRQLTAETKTPNATSTGTGQSEAGKQKSTGRTPR